RFVREYERQPGIGGEVRALGEAVDPLKRCVGALMEVFMGRKVDQVVLGANPFLQTMAGGTNPHLLLRAAVTADEKRRAIDDEQSEEDDFYEGKVAAAKFFVNFILPGVQAKTAAIVGGDRSALDVPERGFSTV